MSEVVLTASASSCSSCGVLARVRASVLLEFGSSRRNRLHLDSLAVSDQMEPQLLNRVSNPLPGGSAASRRISLLYGLFYRDQTLENCSRSKHSRSATLNRGILQLTQKVR